MAEIGATAVEIRPIEDGDVEAVVALSLRAWAPVFGSCEAVLARWCRDRHDRRRC